MEMEKAQCLFLIKDSFEKKYLWKKIKVLFHTTIISKANMTVLFFLLSTIYLTDLPLKY